MDGREGPEVVVWREVRDLYRVDVVVGTGRRAGVMGGSGVAGGEVGPTPNLNLPSPSRRWLGSKRSNKADEP